MTRKGVGVMWDELIFRRMTVELCLVGILHKERKDGTRVTPEKLIEELDVFIKAERTMIERYGRKEAAAMYGWFEEVPSSMETVDFVLTNDFVGYYRGLVERQRASALAASTGGPAS